MCVCVCVCVCVFDIPAELSGVMCVCVFDIPAELSGVVHVGSCFDVALVWVVDGGGSGVGSAQDEDQAVETHCWSVFIIYKRDREVDGISTHTHTPTGFVCLCIYPMRLKFSFCFICVSPLRLRVCV